MDKGIQDKCLSITQLNQLIKTVIDHDPFLSDVYCVGEISSLRIYGQKRMSYLTLCDQDAQLSAICFQDLGHHHWIKVGAKVKLYGRIQFFHRKGQLNLQIQSIQPLGEGELAQSFLELKTKLEKQGYFDQNRKQAIPQYPLSIVIISATPSAAVADFMVLRQKWFSHIPCTIIQTTVQGLECPQSVCDSIQVATAQNPDLMVIMRGGGSVEELAGFNSELIVKAIASSSIPIITAIGHQSDITLSDLAADLSVATPTAAAQILSNPFIQLRNTLLEILETLSENCNQHIQSHKNQLISTLKHSQTLSNQVILSQKYRIQTLFDQLNWNYPFHIFEKGYTRTQTKDGQPIQSISSCKIGDKIVTEFPDGELSSCIESVKPVKWPTGLWKATLKN